MAKSLAHETTRGTLWTSAATYGGKALIFFSTIILAQFLSTEDFGLVAIALSVIAFLEVFQDLGIGSAVIYADDESAMHTGFWLGLVISLLLFGFTWFTAPLISRLFEEPAATAVLRTLGFSFPLFALRNIHEAVLKRRLQFERRFWPELAQTFGKGLLSIGLAIMGFGVWSLVWGQLGGAALAVLAYWKITPWRPRLRLETQAMRGLLSYGLGLVMVNILAVALAQLDYVFIARYFDTDQLGIYRLAFQIPDLLLMQFCVVIAQVMFPVYTRMRDDAAALAQGFLATTRYVALITVPLGLGVALVSGPFVYAILPARWEPAIPVLQAIAIYALLLSLSFNAGDVYKAQGRQIILVWLSLARLAILAPALWWAATAFGTITAVGWAHALVAAFGGMLNVLVAARMVGVALGEVVQALRPALISGAVMVGAVGATLLALSTAPAFVQLLAAVGVGVLSYGGSLWLVERPLVVEAQQTLRGALGRR